MGKYKLGRRNLHNYQIHTILMVLMTSKNKYNIIKREYGIHFILIVLTNVEASKC